MTAGDHLMMDVDGGMGWWMGFGALFWILLFIILIVLIVQWLTPARRASSVDEEELEELRREVRRLRRELERIREEGGESSGS